MNNEYQLDGMFIYNNRHLNGTVLHANGVVLEALMRPSILITDAFNALSVQPSRKQRDLALFGKIEEC
jgi:cleavage and polyadenylation specificity factor subunit 2